MERWELSSSEKEALRRYDWAQSVLDEILTEHVLVNSLGNVQNDPRYEHYSYAFVNPNKMKVGSLGDSIKEKHVPYHNDCLVFLSEGQLLEDLREDIEFRDSNRVTKENISRQGYVAGNFAEKFRIEDAILGNNKFERTLKELLETDCALIVQPDKQKRYSISNYRVNIPSGEKLKRFGQEFCYMDGTFYRKDNEGNRIYDQKLEAAIRNKFLEYYGFSHKAGTRRLAAAHGSFALDNAGYKFTAYVGSGEMRSLAKVTNDFIERFILLYLNKEDRKKLKREIPRFEETYCVDDNIVKFRAIYARKERSRMGGVYSHTHWLKKPREHILPKREFFHARPIEHPVIEKTPYWA